MPKTFTKKIVGKTEIPPLQNQAGRGQLPIDLLEKEDEILVVTPIAGIDLDETEIVVANDVLTIKGKRAPDLLEFGFKANDYYNQECFWGEFSRSIVLPANVDPDLIEATQKNHVLYIRIPKKRRMQMRIIRIK